MPSLGTVLLDYMQSLFKSEIDIPEEELEELRMTSTLEPEEICRLRRVFYERTGGIERMNLATFKDIPCVSINPLKERVAMCFGFEAGVTSLDFPGFLTGVARFNSHGRKDEKLKLAFRLQDFDDDEKLSKEDLKQYLKLVTSDWADDKITDMVELTFREVKGQQPAANSQGEEQYIELSEFIRCMHATDFHTKLVLTL